MNEREFAVWAYEIANKKDCCMGQRLHSGIYYVSNSIRSMVFEIDYLTKGNIYLPAILKLYDDPRLTFEVLAHQHFNQVNTSQWLIAPKIYEAEMVSANKGWMIMEELPKQSHQLSQPLPSDKRNRFLRIYLEYCKKAPKSPNRPLVLTETLPSHEFHIFRIGRWLQLANDREASFIMDGHEPVLKSSEFIWRFESGLQLIRFIFGTRRKMRWSAHGLFKPEDIYQVNGTEKYYLTDFCRAKMYPPGYELASIIWADWMISADWQMSYAEWKAGITDWVLKMLDMFYEFKSDCQFISEEETESDFSELIRASLVERILGTILADVCASARPIEEKRARLNYLYHLLDDLLEH